MLTLLKFANFTKDMAFSIFAVAQIFCITWASTEEEPGAGAASVILCILGFAGFILINKDIAEYAIKRLSK